MARENEKGDKNEINNSKLHYEAKVQCLKSHIIFLHNVALHIIMFLFILPHLHHYTLINSITLC